MTPVPVQVSASKSAKNGISTPDMSKKRSPLSQQAGTPLPAGRSGVTRNASAPTDEGSPSAAGHRNATAPRGNNGLRTHPEGSMPARLQDRAPKRQPPAVQLVRCADGRFLPEDRHSSLADQCLHDRSPSALSYPEAVLHAAHAVPALSPGRGAALYSAEQATRPPHAPDRQKRASPRESSGLPRKHHTRAQWLHAALLPCA